MSETYNLSRKSSQKPNSPTYVDDKEAGKSTGELAVAECIRLARVIKDKKLLPKVCQDYLDDHAQLRQACYGMSHSEAQDAIQARKTGKLTGPQLQRRWTSRENPLATRRTQQAVAQKLVEDMKKKGEIKKP